MSGRELVVALQFVVTSFVHNFVALLRAVLEEDEGAGHGGGGATRLGVGLQGGLARWEDRLKYFNYATIEKMMTVTMFRINSEDRLSRHVAGRRSVVGVAGGPGSGSVTDPVVTSAGGGGGGGAATPRHRIRKSVVANTAPGQGGFHQNISGGRVVLGFSILT